MGTAEGAEQRRIELIEVMLPLLVQLVDQLSKPRFIPQ
jgi:hypothetical protein